MTSRHTFAPLTVLVVALVAAALLAGCVVAPPAPPADTAAHAPWEAPPVTPLQTWEQARRAEAERATAAGHWPEALWAWEQLLALNRLDLAAQAGRAQVRAAQAEAVARQMRVARAARGDAAIDAYLKVLVDDPSHTPAADALRAIERKRTRGGNVRGTRLVASPPAVAAPAAAATAVGVGAGPPPTAVLEDREHAALLAHQGDLAAAIALLTPRAADPGARRQLADLHVLQAERLAATDPVGARAAVAAALRLAPNHPRARVLARQLGRTATPPASASAIPRDMRR